MTPGRRGGASRRADRSESERKRERKGERETEMQWRPCVQEKVKFRDLWFLFFNFCLALLAWLRRETFGLKLYCRKGEERRMKGPKCAAVDEGGWRRTERLVLRLFSLLRFARVSRVDIGII